MNIAYDSDNCTIINGNSVEVLRELADNSLDSVVCDPPYELGFMGKAWDASGIAYSVDLWREVLRVLKPGGHLLAFGGTRTYHRMACAIEDAGFEVRDSLHWIYGTGFPKSLNVSKAIDDAAGATREVVGKNPNYRDPSKNAEHHERWNGAVMSPNATAPATEAAKQWNGWGTALKPAYEIIVAAQKPGSVNSCLSKLHASVAESLSTSNPSAFGVAFVSALKSAGLLPATRGASSDQTDMSRFASDLNSSLSIVSSWQHIWDDASRLGSTSTTETKSSTTTDSTTLNFCLSKITQAITRQVPQEELTWLVATVARLFLASQLSLENTRARSVIETAIARERQGLQGGTAVDEIVMARKPLTGTVASNVLEWGTGALNIDGCRIGDEVRFNPPAGNKAGGNAFNMSAVGMPQDAEGRTATGRWPANVLFDEDAARELDAQSGTLKARGNKGESLTKRPESTVNVAGAGIRSSGVEYNHGDSGGASRFFYCSKPSRKERDLGCEHLPAKTGGEATDREDGSIGVDNPRAGAGRTGGAKNYHPTVKPIELMRYLVRLVTPPGGTVLDPFLGSGTTAMAAILEGFNVIGIELSAEYVEIIKARVSACNADSCGFGAAK